MGSSFDGFGCGSLKPKKRSAGRIWLLMTGAIFLLLAAASALYLNDYYHASAEAMKSISASPSGIEIRYSEDQIDVIPKNPSAGMIFYPGGKVQFEAYVPLLEACAERGILCTMPHMPANLAVLDADAAASLTEAYPDISEWYIAGHSLGGTIAANYAAAHTEDLSGLILLAAYSTEDLSKSDLRVLSVYGSEDGVLNMDRYQKYKDNLPTDTLEIVINGGCHSYFGSYGAQAGDGKPTITREEQMNQTAEAISNFLMKP